MAYKQLPIVQEEFATTKYANQIKDNFDAIIGGQTLRESLTQLSNRLNNVSGQFGQFNEEIQRLITEFNTLRADIDRALDNIDLRFDELSTDIIKKITTISDNLKRLEDSTGYNTNLHQYFKNVNQARNLVLSINKLHEDLGDPRNLTTTIKENTVSSINELDMEIGNLSNLTTTEKGTIVESINELDRDVGNVSNITDGEISASNLSEIIKRMKTLLGTFSSINSAIRRDNFVNSINNLYTILLNKIDSITLKSGKNTNISSDKNIDVLGGVSKDYEENTKYYKNDFLWNDSILYKAIKEFTSSNFISDLNNKNIEEIQTGGSDLNTSKVINTYNENTVFNEGDLIFVTEEFSDIQEQINRDIINKAVPIGCTYIQFAESDGTFSQSSSPSDLYPGTNWQLIFNTESVYFRTEGSLSESGRSSGLQGDAGRNATGAISNYINSGNTYDSGVLYSEGSSTIGIQPAEYRLVWKSVALNFSKQWATANEFRTRNRLIRIYKRIN